MSLRYRGNIVFVTLALVPLIAACGGSPSSTQTNPVQAFKSGYEQLRAPLNQTGDAIGAELQHAAGQTDAQLETTFQQLASRFQSQVSQAETLKPPQNLAADWNSVLDAAKRIESDLTAVVAAAATHSRSAGEQAGASLVADALELRSAAATIKAKLGIKYLRCAPPLSAAPVECIRGAVSHPGSTRLTLSDRCNRPGPAGSRSSGSRLQAGTDELSMRPSLPRCAESTPQGRPGARRTGTVHPTQAGAAAIWDEGKGRADPPQIRRAHRGASPW